MHTESHIDGYDDCCDEFRGAREIGFACPIEGAADWLLYGTDFTSVSAGAPELCYWPIRFCPFCGQTLKPAPRSDLRGRRPFGKS